MKITRRKLLLSGLASGLSLYIGGWWIFKVSEHDATDFITAALNRRLSYLKLDESDVSEFARDYQNLMEESWRETMSWVGLTGFLYRYMDIFRITPFDKKINKIEEEIELQFLLSSDFFIHDADESRTIKYMGIYDPYKRPCSNPLVKYS